MASFNVTASKATQARINRATAIAETKAMIEVYDFERAEARACGYEFPTFSEYCQTSEERYDAALFRAAMDYENS